MDRFKPIPRQPIENMDLLKWIARNSIKRVPEGFTWQFDPAFHQKIITSDDQSTIKKTIHQVGFWYGEHSPFAQKEDLDQVRWLQTEKKESEICRSSKNFHIWDRCDFETITFQT